MNLKPLRKRLEDASKETSLRLDVIQQDYILSWLLVGIFQHPELKSSLIFKGGTALKKGYFGTYRFSEDLDFSVIGELPENLLQSISDACKNAEMQMREYSSIRLEVKKYEEKMPHPEGQQAFIVKAQFPWQSQPLTTAMIEISNQEKVLLSPVFKPLIHHYGELIEINMPLYSLEEIVIEKLRAILQHTKKLHERDWSRSRARDYYDLWRIFGMFEQQLKIEVICATFPMKCSHKSVLFREPSEFFDEKMMQYVSKTWDQWLSPLVPHLPSSSAVIDELKTKIYSIFALSYHESNQ